MQSKSVKTLLKLLLIPALPVCGVIAWVFTSEKAETQGVRLLTREGFVALAEGEVGTAVRFFRTAGRFATQTSKPRRTSTPATPRPVDLILPKITELLSAQEPTSEPAAPKASPEPRRDREGDREGKPLSSADRVARIQEQQRKALAEGNYIWSQHWLMAGDRQRAMKFIREGLELDPSNENLLDAFDDLRALQGHPGSR